MSQSPIFIVGTPRSGTSLTTAILNGHSRVFMGVAVDLFHNVFARKFQFVRDRAMAERQVLVDARSAFYSRFHHKSDHERVDELFRDAAFVDRLLQQQSYRDMFATYMEARATREGKSRWGRADPRDVFDLARIFEFFPDARVIHCVRNPLDFLVSYRDTYKRSARIRDAKRLRNLYHPVLTSLLWKAATRAADRARRRWEGQVFCSRYEDLVADPESRVGRLCEFLEIKFEPAMLSVRINNSSQDLNPNERGIFSNAVGRWREKLPESDAFICQLICGAEMRHMGYVPAMLHPEIRKVSWQVITTPFAALNGWSGNRSWRRSTTPYLPKVVSAIARRM